jgi:hypothetical protein
MQTRNNTASELELELTQISTLKYNRVVSEWQDNSLDCRMILHYKPFYVMPSKDHKRKKLRQCAPYSALTECLFIYDCYTSCTRRSRSLRLMTATLQYMSPQILKRHKFNHDADNSPGALPVMRQTQGPMYQKVKTTKHFQFQAWRGISGGTPQLPGTFPWPCIILLIWTPIWKIDIAVKDTKYITNRNCCYSFPTIVLWKQSAMVRNLSWTCL